MIGILIVSHGNLSSGMLNSMGMLSGIPDAISTLSLTPGVSGDEFMEKVEKEILKLDQGNGVLVLADIQGGTPFISSCRLMREHNIAVVTGVNLGMACEAAQSAEDYDNPQEFAEAMAEVGRFSIKAICQIG